MTRSCGELLAFGCVMRCDVTGIVRSLCGEGGGVLLLLFVESSERRVFVLAEAVRVEQLLPLSNEGQRGGGAGGTLYIELEMRLIISLDLSTLATL